MAKLKDQEHVIGEVQVAREGGRTILIIDELFKRLTENPVSISTIKDCSKVLTRKEKSLITSNIGRLNFIYSIIINNYKEYLKHIVEKDPTGEFIPKRPKEKLQYLQKKQNIANIFLKLSELYLGKVNAEIEASTILIPFIISREIFFVRNLRIESMKQQCLQIMLLA